MPSHEDYYKILGLSRGASDDEIRKAHRKLAKKFHPDANPGDKQAAEKFKKVQEAYSVLGNPEKREQYDRYGAAFEGAGRGPRQRTYTWSGGPGGAGPDIDLDDILGGQAGFGDLFGRMFGGGRSPFAGAGPAGPQAAPPHKGQDIELEIDIPFQIAAEGGSHGLQFQRNGKVERLTVKIPPGVDTGSIVRLPGQGQPGMAGGPAGDLRLKVKVAPHPHFRREGKNLLIEIPVTPAEAALGAKVEVPTLNEGKVTVTVPPGTSTGTRLRLKGKGIVDSKTKQHGDQLVAVKIVLPPTLSDDERRLYEELAKVTTHNPRAGLW